MGDKTGETIEMDGWTAFASITSSLGLVAGGAHWLMQSFVNHRLERDQKDYQAAIDERLAAARAELEKQARDHQAHLDERAARQKSELDASLRRDVDEYLATKAADREYDLDARKRLYSAIGPLRFQLVVACSDFANRIAGIGGQHREHALTLKGYYGRSTLFRLLRLLALTELIDRQMAYADFSVDRSAVTLLSFRRVMFRCLADALVKDDPTNWDKQEQHIFKDTLLILGSAGVRGDAGNARAIRFDELNQLVTTQEEYVATLHPLPSMIEGFLPKQRPLLWLRLVALADVCHALAQLEGPRLGIEVDALDTTALIRYAGAPDLQYRYFDYEMALKRLASAVAVPPANAAGAPNAG